MADPNMTTSKVTEGDAAKVIEVEPATGKKAAAGAERVVINGDQQLVPGDPTDPKSNHHIYDAGGMDENGPKDGSVEIRVNGQTFRYPTTGAVDIPADHLRVIEEAGYKIARV